MGGRICDQSFTNLFCWQDFYHNHWTVLEDRLVIRCLIYGEHRTGYMILPDIRSERLSALLAQLQEDQKEPLTLINLSEEEVDWLQAHYPGQWGIDHNRDYDDYLYETARFQSFNGKKLAAKRNHVNKFQKTYEYSYEPLSAKWFDDCLRLDQEWQSIRGEDSPQAEAERTVIKKAFDNMEALGILGGVLLSSGKPIAFTYGSPLNEETFCIHIEKADTRYEGVYPMMAQLFAQHLPSQYRYLDREEDLGLSGLRKSKESYHPVRMEKKHIAIMMDKTQLEMVDVWTRCFEDEPAFVHSFLARHYLRENAFLHTESDRVMATCLLIVCETEIGRIGYLYAIATLPEYRHRGIAEQLVRQAIERCRELHLSAVALIPASQHLADYYRRIGFSSEAVPIRFLSSLVLGTGNTAEDNALLMPLDPALNIPPILQARPIV